MARLLTFFSLQYTLTEPEWTTVYVPLSAKEIPRNQLDGVIRGWLDPEFSSIYAYASLEDALKSQQLWPYCERYPSTEALRVIMEMRVPTVLIYEEDDSLRINLNEGAELIQVVKILVTAKYVAGYTCEELLPGDKPFDGTVHEIIHY